MCSCGANKEDGGKLSDHHRYAPMMLIILVVALIMYRKRVR